jgi:hypothetical protein
LDYVCTVWCESVEEACDDEWDMPSAPVLTGQELTCFEMVATVEKADGCSCVPALGETCTMFGCTMPSSLLGPMREAVEAWRRRHELSKSAQLSRFWKGTCVETTHFDGLSGLTM